MPGDDLASRTRRVAMATALTALLCLGLPLAVAARVLVLDDERGEVERTAVTTAARLSVDPPTEADRPELPTPESATSIGFYVPSGTLLTGRGPALADDPTTRAAGGVATTTGTAWSLTGAVASAAPVTDGNAVVGVVRVSTGAAALWWRTLAAWAGLAAAAAVAVAVSRALAGRAATRLAEPMEHLRLVAAAVGDGDLSRRAGPSGIREVDGVADALNVTARRLGDLLNRERALGAAASHQLRTPVMRLQLLLDAAMGEDGRRPGSGGAVAQGTLSQAAEEVGVLRAQLEDLLRLTREGPSSDSAGPPTDIALILDGVEHRHAAVAAQRQRRLVVGGDAGLPAVTTSASSLGHALDVLVDNALRHGRGTVRVWARELAGTVAVDVTDEGPGFTWRQPGPGDEAAPGAAEGLGLGLARALVEAQSGRLVLPRSQPSARVTIVLAPGHETGA